MFFFINGCRKCFLRVPWIVLKRRYTIKKFASLKFRSLNETFVDFSQKIYEGWSKIPSRCPEEQFRRRISVNKILKPLVFGVWTEECLTSVRTFCQRWQTWIPCAQKTNLISRFFSEKYVIFSSYMYSKGKLCCFWRKLFGRFKFPEENLEKNMIGEVFFISNLLENQQVFYSVLETKFHQFQHLCILRLRWTILTKKNFLEKSNFFFLFGRWGKR